MSTGLRISREGDMTPPGQSQLRLLIQEDRDVVVTVEGIDPMTERPSVATVEFCDPVHGGGRSPRTLAALHALAEAMAMDGVCTGHAAPSGGDDARLVAAAPDMLKALTQLVSLFDNDSLADAIFEALPISASLVLRALIIDAKAAIAQAEGQS